MTTPNLGAGPKALVAALALSGLAGCDFDTNLAPRVELDIVVDASGVIEHENDLGYHIELTRCRVAIADIELTTDGEMHASLTRDVLDGIHDLFVPTAYAHPGHAAGGEVVGEIPGRFVFDWRDDGRVLGLATMLVAAYSGANFGLTRAEATEGLDPDDPIIGHTFDIAGEATLDGVTVTFEVMLDQDEGRQIIGVPLDLSIDEDSDEAIGLSLAVVNPVEADTVFDGIDFHALDDDADGHVVLEPETDAYNRVRRQLQAHSHYITRVR